MIQSRTHNCNELRIENAGNFAGGISKFLEGSRDNITGNLDLKPGDFIAVAAGKRKTEAQKAAGVIRKIFGNRMEH